MRLLIVSALVGCAAPPSAESPFQYTPPVPDEPVTLTWLGVAGWQLDAADRTILLDPYFSRPDLDAPLVPDAEAIAAHAPQRADLVLVGHSHADHVLDVPAVALATGAQVLGSVSTVRYAKAAGVPDDRLIPIKGGEDYAMDGYSVRVLPSLHSALAHKHVIGGEIGPDPTLPLRFGDFEEGGTFAYLVRVPDHEVLLLSTANFVERELEGLRPDIAVIAPGLRHEVHDYTCRLLRVLGYPRRVYVTHFDDWRAPVGEGEVEQSEDVRAFVEEIAACSAGTEVVVPRPFQGMTVR